MNLPNVSSLVLLALFMVMGSSSAIDNICGIDKSLQLTTSKEFEHQADLALKSVSASCSGEVKTAIRELKTVVHNQDVCSQRKADEIYKFHTDYLLKKKSKVPKPFKNFFVGFALRVSKTCRDMPITRLLEASNELTFQPDWAVVKKYTAKGGLLSMVIDEPTQDYDGDLIPPRNLVEMLKAKNLEVQEQKVYLQSFSIRDIRMVQVVCERRFAPLYEPEVLPLIKLASIGYKYKDQLARRSLETNSFMLEWYRLIFLCESLRNIKLIGEMRTDTNLQQVSILSKQDADELRKKSPQLFQQDDYPKFEQIHYEAAATSLDEPIVDPNNKQLVKAIATFKAKPSLLARFARKLSDFFKDKMARRAIEYNFSQGAVQLGNTRITNIDQLIQTVDAYHYNFFFGQFVKEQGLSREEYNDRANRIFWRTVNTLACFVAVGVITFFVVSAAKANG